MSSHMSNHHAISYSIPSRVRSPSRYFDTTLRSVSPPRASSPGVSISPSARIDLDTLRRSTIRNSGYSLVQLKNFAQQRGLPVYGTKLTLVQRLLAGEEVD